MTVTVGDIARNIYATDDPAEREQILLARRDVGGVIIDLVRVELGLDTLGEDEKTLRVDELLLKSAIRDAYSLGGEEK